MTLQDVSSFIRCCSQQELAVIIELTNSRQTVIAQDNMLRMRYNCTVRVIGRNCEFTGTVVDIRQKKITVLVTDRRLGKFAIGTRVNVPAALATIIG